MILSVHGSSFWNSVDDLLGKRFFRADWQLPANVDCSQNRAAHARGSASEPFACADLKKQEAGKSGSKRAMM